MSDCDASARIDITSKRIRLSSLDRLSSMFANPFSSVLRSVPRTIWLLSFSTAPSMNI